MMKDCIILKGNQHGLAVSIKEDSPFGTVKASLIEKLEAGRSFFGSNKVTLSFDGQPLNDEETNELVQLFHVHSDLEILCVVDDMSDINLIRESLTKEIRQNLEEGHRKALLSYEQRLKALEDENQSLNDKVTSLAKSNRSVKQFELNSNEEFTIHYATLRSGQEVVSDHSIIIMGDVNNGARVEAGGSVFVMGKLVGVVHAGLNGQPNAYVVALDMNPVQLRIQDAYGRAGDKKVGRKSVIEPKIAFVEDGMIVIESIDNKVLKELRSI